LVDPCPQATPTFQCCHSHVSPCVGRGLHACYRFTVLVRVDSLANFWTCNIALHCSQRADSLAPRVFITIQCVFNF
jgi:hypothetical protein